MSLPSIDPFDLMLKPKPLLDGFYWEDIVFVPAPMASERLQEKTKGRLARLGVLLALNALMVGAIRLSVTQPDATEHMALAYAASDPETTGSIQPALRPTLPD